MADKQSGFMEALQLRMINAREQRQVLTTPKKGTTATEQQTKSPAVPLLSPGLAALRGLTPTRKRSQSPVSTTRTTAKRRLAQSDVETQAPRAQAMTCICGNGPNQSQVWAESAANVSLSSQPASPPLSQAHCVDGQPLPTYRISAVTGSQPQRCPTIHEDSPRRIAAIGEKFQQKFQQANSSCYPATSNPYDYTYPDSSPSSSSIPVPSFGLSDINAHVALSVHQDSDKQQGTTDIQHEHHQAVRAARNGAKQRSSDSKGKSQPKAAGKRRKGSLKCSGVGIDTAAVNNAPSTNPTSCMDAANALCMQSQQYDSQIMNEQEAVDDGRQPGRRKVTRVLQPKVVYPPGVWVTEGEDPRQAAWIPPASPFSLLEEVLYDNPWALLLACILLNKTSGRQVRKMLGSLLSAFPTPAAMATAGDEAGQAQLIQILRPLGLFRKRAVSLVRFSKEYLELQWTDPRQLHAVGAYGADAYALFCRGAWSLMPRPVDKDLARYYDWIHATGGQGEGLQRESLEHVLQCSDSAGLSHDICERHVSKGN